MHRRSAVALRIEDAAPTKNIIVCRRCPAQSLRPPELAWINASNSSAILLLCRGPGRPAIMV